MEQESKSGNISKLFKFYFQFLLVWIALVFVFAIFFAFLIDFDSRIPENNVEKVFILLSIVIPQIFVFLLPALVFAYREGSIKQILKLSWNFPAKWLFPIMIGWLALDTFLSAFISISVYILPENISLWLSNELYKIDTFYRNAFSPLGNDFAGVVLIILSGALVPAFCEEFLFRGTIMSKTMEHLSPVTTIIIASLLFAVIHLQLFAIPQLFLFGCYLSVVVLITKSIYPAIIIHFANNVMAFLLLLYDDSVYLNVIQESNDLFVQIGLLLISLFAGILVIKCFFKSKCRLEHERDHTSHA